MNIKKVSVGLAILAVVGWVAGLWLAPALAHRAELINRTIEVNLGDIYIQMKGQEKNAPIKLKAGETVRFTIKNEGKILHDWHMGKEADLKDRLYKTDLIPGFDMIELEPGQSVKLTIQVPKEAGEWEIGCFQPGHYEAGQKAKLIIEK